VGREGAVVNIVVLVGPMLYLGIQAAALSVVGNYIVSAMILVVAFHRARPSRMPI
jgi:hypothetical protein